jgi:hypothetical protein
MVKTFSWRLRMRRIFLSYRRKDSAGETGHLADRVALELGTGSVFMDFGGIPLESTSSSG